MAKAKKLKSGNYRVLVPDYKDENGKWHYKSFTAKTKKEAEYMAMEFSHNRQRSSASYDDLTLKEAYERYIGIKRGVSSPSTIRGYEQYQNKYLQLLMPMKLRNITAELVQASVSELAVTHSPKSVRNIYGLFHSVMSVYYRQLDLSKIRLPQNRFHGRLDIGIGQGGDGRQTEYGLCHRRLVRHLPWHRTISFAG